MNIYEVTIDKNISTTKLADELFEYKKEYRGIALHSSVVKLVRGNTFIRLVLIAEFNATNDYEIGVWNYCTMTDVKRYLSTVEKIDSSREMGFVNEIDCALKKQHKDDLLHSIHKFSRPYLVHIQRTQDYQTYGNYSEYIYITHYMFEKAF